MIMRPFILLLVVACGHGTGLNTQDGHHNDIGHAKKPKWFVLSKKKAMKDREGNPRLHPFFDYSPNIQLDRKLVQYVVTTPIDAPISYELDILSGGFYKSFQYCKQKDIWGKYRGTIYKPPYSKAIIPRLLDQLGRPQWIYIFSDGDNKLKILKRGSLNEAKVIGGVVEQYCKEAPCLNKNSWESKMILLGVNASSRLAKQVNTIAELKDAVNWEYVKAFMQNGDGRHRGTGKDYPAYRIVGEVSPKMALKFTLGFNHLFKWKELTKIKKSCLKLYGLLWNKIEKNWPDAKSKKLKSKEFALDFIDFYQKYGQRFQTCTDFVKVSTILEGAKKHWFFEYVVAFFKLERLGHYYSCSSRKWVENPWDTFNTRKVSPLSKLKKCTASDLDHAFPLSVEKMIDIKNKGKDYYRYIEYDNGAYGTHQKIYSWVRSHSRSFKCIGKNKMSHMNKNKVPLFPKDVSWPSFTNNRLQGPKKVIY